MAPVGYSYHNHGPGFASESRGSTSSNDECAVPHDVIVETPPHSPGGARHSQPPPFTKEGNGQQRHQHLSFDSTASENSSLTTDSDHESEDDDDDDSSDEHKPSSQKSAQELLEKAQARLQLAKFESKINHLKEELMEKNEKITTLTLQLRRATASKCDLVVACSDIESQKISLEEMHGREERRWKQMPLREQEVRAQVEKEFMNELSLLMDQMNDLKRRHRNQLLEKDFEIAQLQEKLRRREMGEDLN